MDDELKELLERLHDKYNRPEFIEDDPISVPHRYTDRADREIAGFLAATIAWGNRRAIVTSGHRMMRCMDDAPADFVRNASDRELATLETYVHRTFNGRDLRDFVLALRRMDRRFGGLGVFFEERYAAVQSIPAVLSEFRREFFSCDHAPRCEKHLSSIDRGAACKRLCMFLRWMVRRDERGVDFGLWTRIPMSALYIPLDLHTGDMARALGLLSRRQNDWRAVEEVTAALRGFDPADPVRYDFSLFGAGIDARNPGFGSALGHHQGDQPGACTDVEDAAVRRPHAGPCAEQHAVGSDLHRAAVLTYGESFEAEHRQHSFR